MENIDESIEKKLLKRRFDGVNIIDAVNGTYEIKYFKHASKEVEHLKCGNYDDGNVAASKIYTQQADQNIFLKRTSLNAIIEALEESEVYSFAMTGVDLNGSKHINQYSYCYLDDSKRWILATLEDISKITDYDVLTGELSRSGFLKTAAHVIYGTEERRNYAILFYNIKGFKVINELFGVEGGDRVLRDTADAFRRSALDPILIARFEADHFVMLIDREKLDYDVVTSLCSSLFERNGRTFKVYGRFGIYPVNSTRHEISGMCDRAKLAKDYITDDYVRPYAVYNQIMRESFVKKKKLAGDLENALKSREFAVFYQPVYNPYTNEIVSAEALVRWIHPEMGILSPGEFISIFEENGYISELDYFVQKEVGRLVRERQSRGQKLVPISINMSRMDFYDDGIMNGIAEDVKNVDCISRLCRIEVTESAFSAFTEIGSHFLREMKKAGVKILLDDFGSEYSAYSTIRDFDFDIIKLDMGFVKMIGKSDKTECIIRSIIDMAHNMNQQVIAEGVENQQQRDFLMECKCDAIQGFYYSKPLPETEFTALLENLT